MTPTEVVAAARDLYNGTGDSFFSDLQIYNWIWQAENELCRKAWILEATSSQSTVASTQTYAYPTRAIAIKRVFVNGRKLKRITDRDDQAITLSNQSSATSGWPIYYTDFSSILSLRPIPDAVYTLAMNYYAYASLPSATGTIDVPTLFHFELVDYVLWRMYSKDKAIDDAMFHKVEWKTHVQEAIQYKARMKRTDAFATVQSEDTLPVTILGEA